MKLRLLACLLLAQVSLAHADEQPLIEDPWTVLEKAAHAARHLSYQGIFVFDAGQDERSVQITHMNYGQGEYARMVMLDGQPREVLRQGSNVVIFSPREEKVVIEKRRGQKMFPALLPPEVKKLRANYAARMGGLERVGGRVGQIVFLDPRDQYRYAYKFWADREYGILLKYMVLNQKGEAIEKITFNQLTLMNTQAMDWFQPNIDHGKPYVMQEPAASLSAEDEAWTLKNLPAGYVKTDQVKSYMAGKPLPVTHLIFSDGLASVSLFIEPLTRGVQAKSGHSVIGSTSFHAAVQNGHQIMVVGEVPEATVSQIANAVSFKK